MSLATFAASTATGSTLSLTAETGLIVEEKNLEGSITGTDAAHSPSAGEAVIRTYHHDGIFQLGINGVATGSTGIMAETLGSDFAFATSVALCGHTNASATKVVTGLNLTHPFARLQRLACQAEVLSGIQTA